MQHPMKFRQVEASKVLLVWTARRAGAVLSITADYPARKAKWNEEDDTVVADRMQAIDQGGLLVVSFRWLLAGWLVRNQCSVL